ncbi:MAG: BadF/BadG/BcrA/BcrD ATPase family protein [Anaerolineae bacterium]
MSAYYLGVDVGSSKTHGMIVDQDGEILGFAQDGAGNHETVGVDEFRAVVHRVVNATRARANLEQAPITGMGFGVAGYDWESDLPLMRSVIDSLGLNAPYQVVSDAMPGLIAGSRRGWGVCVTAGTGVNARGRDETHQRLGRITGNSASFGEYGGGGELARQAIQLISRAWSLRGEQTILTDLFCAKYGAPDATELLEGLARGRYHIKAMDALMVFEAADRGDAVALKLLHWSAEELANIAIGVIRQLDIQDKAFEVILSGSLFKSGARIIDVMRDEVHKVAPAAEMVRLEAPPCVGAVMLGMEAAGIDYRPLREKLITNARAYYHTFTNQ